MHSEMLSQAAPEKQCISHMEDTQNAADLQSTSPTCVFTLLFIEGYGSVHRHMFRHSTCGVTSPYACKMPKIVTHSHTLSLHRRSHRTYNTTSPPPKTTHFTHEPHFPTHTHRHSTTLCCLSPKHATIATAKLRFVRDERETSPNGARANVPKSAKRV